MKELPLAATNRIGASLLRSASRISIASTKNTYYHRLGLLIIVVGKAAYQDERAAAVIERSRKASAHEGIDQKMSPRKPPLNDDVEARIKQLLEETDMTMPEIAARMKCSRSTVASVNRKWKVRTYDGTRARWQKRTDVSKLR